VAQGIDPAEHRKAAKIEAITRHTNNFEAVAREWFEKQEPRWALSHSSRLIRLLERDVFPFHNLGARPISELTPPEVLAMLRPIEARAAETAHRALQTCSQVFRYGIATSRCVTDLTRDLRGALAIPRRGHFAATTEPRRLGSILRALDDYRGSLVVSPGLRLGPMLFVRPGELRKAKWIDMNFDDREWRYRVTKTGVNHIVPLARQALTILQGLHDLTGNGEFVFPSARGDRRPMSDNAVLVAMRSIDISKEEMTGHGFRAVARTILDDILGFRVEIIEHQLAHTVRDALGTAYNRTQFLSDRHRMIRCRFCWKRNQGLMMSFAQPNITISESESDASPMSWLLGVRRCQPHLRRGPPACCEQRRRA
jgi:integrase